MWWVVFEVARPWSLLPPPPPSQAPFSQTTSSRTLVGTTHPFLKVSCNLSASRHAGVNVSSSWLFSFILSCFSSICEEKRSHDTKLICLEAFEARAHDFSRTLPFRTCSSAKREWSFRHNRVFIWALVSEWFSAALRARTLRTLLWLFDDIVLIHTASSRFVLYFCHKSLCISKYTFVPSNFRFLVSQRLASQ